MKWIKVLIQCFLLSAAECGSHSLEFLSTGRVQPGDRPQFEQLTVFDGVPISYCDSLTRREEFRPSLESKNLPQNCDEASYNILGSLYKIPPFLNNTVYIVQRRRGCIQSANRVVSAFEAWAVNGMDFVTFDPESQTWTSQSPSAVALKHRWNNNSPRNFGFQHFIREQCPEMIQRIKLRSTPQKTELRVFAKPTEDTDQALLRCHMTTTDKSVTLVHLIGDGASKASWITMTGPVPSEDGCVILRLTAGISLRENTNKYGCRVQTGGHNFTVYWDGNTLDGRNLLHKSSVEWNIQAIGGVFCFISVVILIFGMTFLLKCGKKNSTRDDAQLMELFTKIMEIVDAPHLRHVIVPCTQDTVTNSEQNYEQWASRMMSEDQDLYDPEYFAHQIDGPLQ